MRVQPIHVVQCMTYNVRVSICVCLCVCVSECECVCERGTFAGIIDGDVIRILLILLLILTSRGQEL